MFPAQAPPPNRRVINLHHHFISPACIRALAAKEGYMQGLKTVVGASQIVFGDDYPFGAGPAKHLQGLQKCGFSADELQGIYRQNALRIVPQCGA
jgi:predicted TIM-barrel fold metal-dependent hydrolase